MLLEIHEKTVKCMGEEGKMVNYPSHPLGEGGVGEAVGFGPQPGPWQGCRGWNNNSQDGAESGNAS